MPLEHRKAEMLRGYKFFHHPDLPTIGILRLDTDNEKHFVMVTKKLLQALAEAATKHAEELKELQ
jgi:hypothetical protein